MSEILEPIATVVPAKYAGHVALLLVASQVLGRAFHALRTGGGLKSLFTSIWLGTNTPKANQPGGDDKNQRRLFTGLLCIGLASAIGCATAERSGLETKAFAITRLVVKKYLDVHPEYRLGFETARDDLQILANSEAIGLEELLAIVSRLPTLKDDDVALYVETGVLFFADELGTVAVKNPAQVRQAAAGMVRGMNAILKRLDG